jgi:hypothetical protein
MLHPTSAAAPLSIAMVVRLFGLIFAVVGNVALSALPAIAGKGGFDGGMTHLWHLPPEARTF